MKYSKVGGNGNLSGLYVFGPTVTLKYPSPSKIAILLPLKVLLNMYSFPDP